MTELGLFLHIFIFLTIFPFNSQPTGLLVLCHPFGTFFVRVCNVAALFFRVYRYGFIGDQTWLPRRSEELLFLVHWIIRMPSMVFDVIL